MQCNKTKIKFILCDDIERLEFCREMHSYERIPSTGDILVFSSEDGGSIQYIVKSIVYNYDININLEEIEVNAEEYS